MFNSFAFNCNFVLDKVEGASFVFTCLFVSEAYIRAYNIVSSAVFIFRPPGVLPPQQCSYLGVCIDSIGSSYLGLNNSPSSRYPIGVCNIVIPAAYLYAEGCTVFIFHVVSKAHIKAYNNISSAVLISRPGVFSPQKCSYLGLCIDYVDELLPVSAELSSQQIS